MAPKAAPQDNAHAKFLLNCLHHLSENKIDWEGVAGDNGIGYGRNATARFNSIAKHYGYKWEAGKCIVIDGGAAAATTVDSTTPAPKTPRKKTGKGTDNDATPTPAKKRKVQDIVEDDNEDDDDDVTEEALSGDEDQV